MQQKYPGTQPPAFENRSMYLKWRLEQKWTRFLPHIHSKKSRSIIKDKRGKCVIQLDCKFTQWNWLRISPTLPPLPASYLGARLEEQDPSLHGNLAATSACPRIKEKKGRSNVWFHLLHYFFPVYSFERHICTSLLLFNPLKVLIFKLLLFY